MTYGRHLPVLALCTGWVALCALLLGGCETTAQKSARLARENKFKLSEQAGLDVKQASKQIVVVDEHIVSDDYGSAVVVELENRSEQPFVAVPVELSVADAHGDEIFRNDTPGLDRGLTHLASIESGDRAVWIYDQLSNVQRGAKPTAKVGDGKPAKVKELPQFEISGTEIVHDPDGIAINGKIGNRSEVAQRKLILYGIVRRGKKVVAAGTAQVEKLAPKRGARFQMFFIGDPAKGDVEYFVPPNAVS
jgi:hypothetical protein